MNCEKTSPRTPLTTEVTGPDRPIKTIIDQNRFWSRPMKEFIVEIDDRTFPDFTSNLKTTLDCSAWIRTLSLSIDNG